MTDKNQIKNKATSFYVAVINMLITVLSIPFLTRCMRTSRQLTCVQVHLASSFICWIRLG